jgi:hypothetical protein
LAEPQCNGGALVLPRYGVLFAAEATAVAPVTGALELMR